MFNYDLFYSLDVDQLMQMYLCVKHFDPQDIFDTQTWLDFDGEKKLEVYKLDWIKEHC